LVGGVSLRARLRESIEVSHVDVEDERWPLRTCESQDEAYDKLPLVDVAIGGAA
jgi:hypothetical protein